MVGESAGIERGDVAAAVVGAPQGAPGRRMWTTEMWEWSNPQEVWMPSHLLRNMLPLPPDNDAPSPPDVQYRRGSRGRQRRQMEEGGQLTVWPQRVQRRAPQHQRRPSAPTATLPLALDNSGAGAGLKASLVHKGCKAKGAKARAMGGSGGQRTIGVAMEGEGEGREPPQEAAA